MGSYQITHFIGNPKSVVRKYVGLSQIERREP